MRVGEKKKGIDVFGHGVMMENNQTLLVLGLVAEKFMMARDLGWLRVAMAANLLASW